MTSELRPLPALPPLNCMKRAFSRFHIAKDKFSMLGLSSSDNWNGNRLGNLALRSTGSLVENKVAVSKAANNTMDNRVLQTCIWVTASQLCLHGGLLSPMFSREARALTLSRLPLLADTNNPNAIAPDCRKIESIATWTKSCVEKQSL